MLSFLSFFLFYQVSFLFVRRKWEDVMVCSTYCKVGIIDIASSALAKV